MRILLRLTLLISCLVISGCMVLPVGAAKVLTTEQVDNAVKLIQETNGTGCIYARGGATFPPAQGALDVVGTIGPNGGDYVKCLDALRKKPEL